MIRDNMIGSGQSSIKSRSCAAQRVLVVLLTICLYQFSGSEFEC